MPQLRYKLSMLFRNSSQTFNSHSSSVSRQSSRTPPRDVHQAQTVLHPDFTKHLSSQPMTLEEMIHTIPCHSHSCLNTITIIQSTTTKELSTPISLKLSQTLPISFSATIKISTTVDLQDTAFMQEVNMYKDLLEDEKYCMIGGNYDDDGREVLIEGERREVSCVNCGGVWKFVVRCVKKRGGVKVVLDFE